MAEQTWIEQLTVKGDELVAKVKEVVADNRTKRVILRGQDGRELLSMPVNLGVAAGGVAVLAAPVVAAVAAVAAIVTKVQVEVERVGEPDDDAPDHSPVPRPEHTFRQEAD